MFRYVGLLLLVCLQCVCADDSVVSNTELCRRMYAPIANVRYAEYEGVFLVDTGASRTTITGPQSLLAMPDKSWKISRSNVQTQIGVKIQHHIHGIPVGAFNRKPSPTDVFFDEAGKDARSTTWIDGILGVPQFGDGTLRINLRDSVCEFTKLDSETAFGTVLKFQSPSRLLLVPTISVHLDSTTKMPVCVDTGSHFFMTFSKYVTAEILRLGMLQKAGTINSVLDGRPSRIETFILRKVTIGGFEFRDVLVLQTEVNTVGRQFIDCFDTTIDFPKREMRLKPLETEWPLRIPPDASGLILSFRDTDLLLVVRMEPDSAAVRSGLLEGDRVLLFEGKSPKDTSMRAMRKRLTEAGTTVKLKILRDGKELDIDLPLSRSYEYPPKWPELNTDTDDFFKSLQKEKKPAADR